MFRPPLTVAATVAALVIALPVGPADATPGQPLRTLVYTVTFTSRTTNEEQTSGFLAREGAAPYGSATVKRSADVDDSGRLNIDVIAATDDGSLAVDASFTGKTTHQEPIRVVVFSDGRLSFDPSRELSPVASRILPLLARGLPTGRDMSPGSTWTTALAAPFRGTTAFRVQHVSGDNATLAIGTDINMSGPNGFAEHDDATATYDMTRLCPTELDLTAQSRHQPTADQYVTTHARLIATLVTDSFAKQ